MENTESMTRHLSHMGKGALLSAALLRMGVARVSSLQLQHILAGELAALSGRMDAAWVAEMVEQVQSLGTEKSLLAVMAVVSSDEETVTPEFARRAAAGIFLTLMAMYPVNAGRLAQNARIGLYHLGQQYGDDALDPEFVDELPEILRHVQGMVGIQILREGTMHDAPPQVM